MKLPTTYYNVTTSEAKVQIHQGGTRSGKTYSILTALVELCWLNDGAGIVITIVRKTFPAIRASCYRDFFEIIEREGLYNPVLHNKSDATYSLFGNLIEFVSADQPQKLRGRKRDILFVNEANEIHLEDWRQLILRTTGKVIIDYNPSDSFHWIYDEVIPRDDADFFQTTYLDNPFLPQEVIDEIERLKETDENYWRIYGLGERGLNTAAVFTTYHEATHIPESARLIAYGLDWGFTNDPTAMIAVWIHGHHLYLDEVLYSTGLTNQDLVEEIRKLIPEGDRTEIVADSAEPKSIEELHRHGINIKPSHKGQDSIRVGIDVMKRHSIYITKESRNLRKEMQNYKWKTDKNDRQLNHPEDKHNHAIDAVRYVCLNKLTKNYSGQYHIA